MSANGPNHEREESVWRVYVLRSLARQATYVGIAKDPETRLSQHNGLRPGGAKSTRSGRPWVVANELGPYATRGEAQAVEYQVKRLSRPARLAASTDDFPADPREGTSLPSSV